MDADITCNQCGNKATIVRLVDDLGELAAVGRVLGISGPADPYLLIECPQCGVRAIPPPGDRGA